MICKPSAPEESQETQAVFFCLSQNQNTIREDGVQTLAGSTGQTMDAPHPHPPQPLSRCSQTRTATILSTMQPTRLRTTRKRTWCSPSGPLRMYPLRPKWSRRLQGCYQQELGGVQRGCAAGDLTPSHQCT